MRFIVSPHKIEKDKLELVNEKEINVSECEFIFTDEIPDDFVKEALFTFKNNTYKIILANNKCYIPTEVLEEAGTIEIGIVAYKLNGDEYVERFNPRPIYIDTLTGSLREAQNTEEVTASDKEQMEQMLSNINVGVSKVGDTATITIRNVDGETTTATITDGINGQDGKDGTNGRDGIDGKDGTNGTDGKSLEYNWDGTSLGIRQEGQSQYEYVNLKGETGATGQQGPAGQDGQNGRDGTNGQDGYTPVKGVDYFTQEDIASLNIPSDLGDLTNSADYIKGLVQLTYGSSTWNDFQTAYNANKIVYCAVDGRRAFMAYVGSNNVEFQYYRSLSSPSASSQVDEVYVYKLTNGNVWSTVTRNASNTITVGTGLTRTYTTNTRTVDLSVDTTTIATKQYVDNAIGTALNNNY